MKKEINLHGTWRFQLGERATESFLKPLPNEIEIPGILQSQGYGDEVTTDTPWVQSLYDKLWYKREEYKYAQEDKTRVPFIAQPPKHYLGKAWYQKEFLVGKKDAGKDYVLKMECTRWKSCVWVDETFIGEETSLCGPHDYDLGTLKEGKHILTVCIDNSWQLPYRPDGHGVSDALGATWNGIVGNVCLEVVEPIHMKEVRVFSDIETKMVDFEIILMNKQDDPCMVEVEIDGSQSLTKQVLCKNGVNRYRFTIQYPEDTPLWDEFSPNLQTAIIRVNTSYGIEEREVHFGIRKIETKDGLFLVNGRPTYLRGTHFGGDFPLTGYPSTDINFWRNMIKKIQEWGLNFIRFHSYCPPEAAFVAADELGMYLHVECAMWNVFGKGLSMNEVLENESKKILHYFGNHPSFLMLSPSNEPGGDWYAPLSQWVKKVKEFDNRHIYTIQSGWPYPVKPADIEGTDYVYFHRSGYGIEPGGTIRNSKGWYGKDYRESLEGIKYPVICHELGQWCSYPDYNIIEKFTGYMYPGNYVVFRENMKAHGLLDQNKEFAFHSGKWQAEMYKEDLEANFRTPHVYGFELLDLHDYLGQGTALVGVLDAFWEEKGYIKANEFRNFCSATVPLLRIAKRVYANSEIVSCPLEFCHFDKEELQNVTVCWELRNSNGNVCREGNFENITLPLAKNIEIGTITFDLDGLKCPEQYSLHVYINGTNIKNSWMLWVYNLDDKLVEENNFLYTRSFEKAVEALKAGKKVILSPTADQLSFSCPPLAFKPAFWNSQMGPTWARGMGLLIDAQHPALKDFPTDTFQSWQWEKIMAGAKGINLEGMPLELHSIVQPIDEWNRNYRLGMIFECKVEQGSLLCVTADLENDLEGRPAAKQLRNSLWRYVESDQFNPQVCVPLGQLQNCFYPTTIMKRLLVQATLEEDPSMDLSNVMNGNPNTYCVTKPLGYPYHIMFSMKTKHTFEGFIYMPRQNQREHEGEIKAYEIEYKKDGIWTFLCQGEFLSSFDPKKIHFPHSVYTDGIRFIAKSGHEGKNFPRWTMTTEGWFMDIVENYEDKVMAIADLSLLCSDDLGEEIISRGIDTFESSTATQEIDN